MFLRFLPPFSRYSFTQKMKGSDFLWNISTLYQITRRQIPWDPDRNTRLLYRTTAFEGLIRATPCLRCYANAAIEIVVIARASERTLLSCKEYRKPCNMVFTARSCHTIERIISYRSVTVTYPQRSVGWHSWSGGLRC